MPATVFYQVSRVRIRAKNESAATKISRDPPITNYMLRDYFLNKVTRTLSGYAAFLSREVSL